MSSPWGKLPWSLSHTDVDNWVNLTVEISPWMLAHHAAEIITSGYRNAYLTDSTLRSAIDAYCKADGFAGLTLEEYLLKCNLTHGREQRPASDDTPMATITT